MKRAWSFLFLAVFLSSLLISCGQPVCVMGMGDCKAPDKTPTSSSISLTSNFTTIHASASNGSTSAVLTISGGNTPYAISISSGSIAGGINAGYFKNSSNNEVQSLAGINTRTVTFYAYTTVTTSQTVTLKVTDSSSTALEKTITLTVDP